MNPAEFLERWLDVPAMPKP